MKTLHIFDLDGTTIDSFHRVQPCLKLDGDLDLQKYKSTACTHDLIQNDTLLPLAQYMKSLVSKGEPVAICTARLMHNSDYVYLRKNGMRVNTICSRDQLHKHFEPDMSKVIYRMKDADYKRFYLKRLQELYPLHNMIIYDDHDGVLKMAQEFGIMTIDAKEMNQVINAGYTLGYQDAIEDYESEIEDMMQSFLVA